MYHTTLIVLLMTSMTYGQPDGKATTIRKAFNRTTTVSTSIDADRAIIWALLTNAADYARWN